MKWRLLLLAAAALTAPLHTEEEKEEQTEIVIVDENGESVSDLVLGIYEDAEFRKPVTDGDGKEITVMTEKDGTCVIPVKEEICYVRSRPVTGYYPVVAAVHRGEGGSLVRYAVHVEFEVTVPDEDEKDVILEITDEKENVITEWNSADPFRDSGKLDAGKTYRVRMKEAVPYRAVMDPQLIIPDTKPEELKKEIRIAVYGEETFQTQKETGAVYTLYTDEEHRKKAEDIYGKEVRIEAGEPATAALLPGMYWVLQDSISEDWYVRKEPVKLTVRAEESTEFALKEEQVHVCIEADADCTIHVSRPDGPEEEMHLTAGSPAVLQGKRQEKVRISRDPLPGYFNSEEVSCMFAETAGEQQAVQLSLHPFAAYVSVKDRNSGTLLKGGEIRVCDAHGKTVFSGTSDAEPLSVSGLAAGSTYSVMLEGTAEHHYPVTFRELRIPARYSQADGDVFEAVIECRPYTAVTLEEGSGQLYLDDACVRKAADIYGRNVILSQEPSDLAEGIYWLMPEARDGCYLPEGAVKVEVNGEARLTVPSAAEPVRLTAEVTDDSGKPVNGAVIQLLDAEKEKILAQKIQEDGEIVFGEDVMRAGETYFVRQIAAPPQYLKETADMEVTVPETKQEDLLVTLHNRHYSTLVLHIFPDMRTPDEQWTVYAEDGTPAQDIYHNPALLHPAGQEEASVQLCSGTYVLKQTQCTPGIWPDTEEIRVVIGEEDLYEVSRQNTATALFVRIEQEDGERLSGLVLQAAGTDGTVYDTWNAETHEHRVDGIPAGETVILKAVKLPDGYTLREEEYRITMPQYMPETPPEAEILVIRRPVHALLPKHIADQEVPPTLPWGILTGAGSLVLMGIRFLLRKTQRM